MLRSRRIRRSLVVASIAVLGIALVLFALFPGRLGMAITIGTGIGTRALQERIDGLEGKAIRGAAFSQDDKEFLADFYRTLGTGAKLSVLVRQTGRLMDHYLDGSGADYQLEPEIFSENAKVQRQMSLLRKRALTVPCAERHYASPTFYMPDVSKVDSVFGLYHGRVLLTGIESADGTCTLRWRAEVPWIWPSYASLKKKYGDYHAESFPLPNLKCIFGRQHALYVDNGLGEYLVHLGLAKPFLAFAEWEER